MREKILQKDYTKLGTVLQLHLPMDIEFSIPKDNPAWLVHDGVERMDLSKLYGTYAHLESNEVTPRQMLKLVVFAAMHGVRSSRAIEDFCQNRIDCRFLLDEEESPGLLHHCPVPFPPSGSLCQRRPGRDGPLSGVPR